MRILRPSLKFIERWLTVANKLTIEVYYQGSELNDSELKEITHVAVQELEHRCEEKKAGHFYEEYSSATLELRGHG